MVWIAWLDLAADFCFAIAWWSLGCWQDPVLLPPCPALPWVSGTAPFRRRTGSLARLTWSYPWPCCTLVMSCIHPIKLMFGVARAFGVAVCVYCKAAELWGDGEDAAPTRTWFTQTLLLLNPLHVALAMCGLWQAGNFSLCAVFWKPV